MKKLSVLRAFIISILGGILYCFGFPLNFFPAIFFGPILGMAVVTYCWSATDPVINGHYSQKLSSELATWIGFSLVCNLIGHYWIGETLREFGNIPFPANYLLASLFTLVIMPHYLVFLLLWRFIPAHRNPIAQLHSPILANFFLAIALTTFEVIVPKQFPAHMGHAWMHIAPYLGLAPIFGVAIYSFVSFWAALGIVTFFKKRIIDWGALTSLTVVVALSIIFSLSPSDHDKTLNVRMVQPNIGNHLKLSLELGSTNAAEQTYELYERLSTIPSKLGKLDLIIWPETAFPALGNSQELKNGTIPPHPVLSTIANTTGADLLFGGYDANPAANINDEFYSQYNAAFYLQYDPNDSELRFSEVYHKRILIPFGERLPLGPFSKYVMPYIQNISYFATGTRFPLFTLKSGHHFTMAICYEVLFYDYIRSYLNTLNLRPHFLVNMTNDSWYGRTSEPYQHLFLSKWRALEFQLPLVRITNTGITSIIYPDGSESQRTPLFTAINLDIPLKLRPVSQTSPTLFQQYGFWLMWPLWGGIFVLLIVITRVRRSNSL